MTGRTLPFLKILWGMAVSLNLMLLAERLIARYTDYFVLEYSHANEFATQVLGFVVLLTIVILGITLFRVYLRRKHGENAQKRYLSHLLLLLFTLLYSLSGFSCWMLASLGLSAIARTVSYPSPSGRKAVVFKEVAFPHASLIRTYEKRGIFQRRVVNTPSDASTVLGSTYDQRPDPIVDSFFDPTQLKRVWSQDETIFQWQLNTDSKPISGVVTFE